MKRSRSTRRTAGTLFLTTALTTVLAAGLAVGAVSPAMGATAQPPTPTDSAPTDATPTDPAPTNATPTDPAPIDPTLQAMNDAHDHAMGSTLPQFEPQNVESPNEVGSGSVAGGPRQLFAAPQAVASHVQGMDVSGWQPDVDWNAAWADGARFVYIKATESTDYTSSHFSGQYAGATAVGMIRGAYHFANPYESSGAAQANYFVNNGGGWSPDGRTLPPMLDIEYDPYTQSDGTNACYGLSAGQMVNWIADFSNTVLARTGIRPTIYTTTGWWKTCTGNNGGFGSNPLFIARWPENVSDGAGTLPAGWGSYAMWQYADAGVFPGDQDLYNGDYSALRLFASNGQAPAGGTTLDSNYITALYHDYLTRSPSNDDIVWWENMLATGAPRSSIASGFVNSDEYRLIRIDAAYQSVLGRAADAGGRQAWLSAMQTGAITTDDIQTQFYASTEYYLQHGNTDPTFVASLYSTLLHRTDTASDAAFWSNLVVQHGRAWVIAQFWDSTETITQRVSAMYQLYLGRTPDAAGLQNWVNVALQVGDSGLRSGFTSSDEYFARAQTRTY